ncbi:MAG TPA: ring-cleaving dioxygenase [Opitutaceae bacterium]
MQLTGIHHLTAITAHAPGNHEFYVHTLGMRLVKKTVNQDDVSAYHLFYADGQASPGTDVTFFDWPAAPERRGTHSITRTGLRVASTASLAWWKQRFGGNGVKHGAIAEIDGRPTLEFEDREGQRLSLVVDEHGGDGAHPWPASPVPAEHQVRGLGPITLSVPHLEPTDRVLTTVMNMRRPRDYLRNGIRFHVYEMGAGGPAAELHVAVEPDLPRARQGAGGVHHVAFRTPDDEQYRAWAQRLAKLGMPSSGPVDRYYFRSLYFREPNGILFEIATDGPGFAVDEPMETLGERLALPLFLEPRRGEIEAGLKPL